MQHLLEHPNEIPPPSARLRAVMIGIAVVVTLFLGTLAYVLGSWAFEYRLRSSHHGRLARLVPQKPVLEQVDLAFKNEGTAFLAAPANERQWAEALSRWGSGAEAELSPKLRAWPKTRIYQAGKEMVYFVFFDKDDVLSDFTCVRQR